MNRTWTKEQDAQLRTLHKQGFSFNQIAGMIGVTRNACVGKAHRLGLVSSKPPGRSKCVRREKSSPVRNTRFRPLAVPTQVVPAVYQPTEESVTLFDLQPHHCRWPVGDAPFMFCGGVKMGVGSYCQHHRGISIGR